MSQKKENMIVEDKHIYIYGEIEKSTPLVIYNTFQGDGKELFESIKNITDKAFTLAVIGDINWDDEMTPWECPPLYKNDSPCTGGADRFLEKITEDFLPAIKKELKSEPEYLCIAGYSLGGLFAIYSLFNTDIFKRAASASGSMWFPDFSQYIKDNPIKSKVDRVYFSLGDKEANSKNPLLRTVAEKTAEVKAEFDRMEINTVFESNPGNHFKDADFRMAKGVAWMIQ